MPEKILVEKWKALDGKVCDTRKDAEAHEAANFHLMLCGLSAEEVQEALELKREPIAGAIERAALEIKRARRAKADAAQEPHPQPDP